MNIQYLVCATIPFLSAIALVGNKIRDVEVLSSDGTKVSADVEQITIENPRSDAKVTMTLCADEVLPGVLSHQGQESIRVIIPGTEGYETFVVRSITSY